MLSTHTNINEALASAIIAVEDAWDCAYDGHVFRYRKDKIEALDKIHEALTLLETLKGKEL